VTPWAIRTATIGEVGSAAMQVAGRHSDLTGALAA
jgi:hypothetical protein